MKEMSVWELAEIVRHNLKNLGTMVPGLDSHPMFAMLMQQAESLVKKIEEEEDES